MSQTFFVNPGMASVRYKGKPATRKKFHAAGFSRNPSKRRAVKRTKRPTAKQVAARKKFAAMSRARAAAARKGTRALTHKGGSMARRKRKAGARRRSTTVKRRRVSAKRRRVYAANPRRRTRKHAKRRSSIRRYRRNPGMGSMIGGVKDTFIGAGAVLGGMAAGRFVSGLIPLNASNAAQQPLYDFAKGVLVSVAVRMLGRKVIGEKYATLAAIGVLVGPSRALILSYAPSASAFLGNGVMAMPRFTNGSRALPGTAAYPGGVAAYTPEHLSSYSEGYPN